MQCPTTWGDDLFSSVDVQTLRRQPFHSIWYSSQLHFFREREKKPACGEIFQLYVHHKRLKTLQDGVNRRASVQKSFSRSDVMYSILGNLMICIMRQTRSFQLAWLYMHVYTYVWVAIPSICLVVFDNCGQCCKNQWAGLRQYWTSASMWWIKISCRVFKG